MTVTFSHKNIVRGCSNWTDLDKTRDFATIEDHDAHLLARINERVRAADTLYHLGDFGLGFAWKDRFKELRSQIKCETVYLALGNHDNIFHPHRKGAAEYRSLFKDVRDLYYRKICGRAFVLCHYAMRTWPWQHHESIHLYGHSHGNLPDDPNSLSMDVGVDTNLFGHTKYEPYSIDEVFEIMDKQKRFTAIDHHRLSPEKYME